MERQREERSLGELFAELSRETSTLVKQEVELAKSEMSQKASRFGKHAGIIAAGGFVAYLGAFALTLALIALLSMELPVWVAALIVSLVFAAGGYFMIQKGLKGIKQTNLTPERTIETLKEDARWAKEQIK